MRKRKSGWEIGGMVCVDEEAENIQAIRTGCAKALRTERIGCVRHAGTKICMFLFLVSI